MAGFQIQMKQIGTKNDKEIIQSFMEKNIASPC